MKIEILTIDKCGFSGCHEKKCLVYEFIDQKYEKIFVMARCDIHKDAYIHNVLERESISMEEVMLLTIHES